MLSFYLVYSECLVRVGYVCFLWRVFNVNFVYALKEDNSKFVEFIVKATLE